MKYSQERKQAVLAKLVPPHPADGQRRGRRGRHFPRDPLLLVPAGTP